MDPGKGTQKGRVRRCSYSSPVVRPVVRVGGRLQTPHCYRRLHVTVGTPTAYPGVWESGVSFIHVGRSGDKNEVQKGFSITERERERNVGVTFMVTIGNLGPRTTDTHIHPYPRKRIVLVLNKNSTCEGVSMTPDNQQTKPTHTRHRWYLEG